VKNLILIASVLTMLAGLLGCSVPGPATDAAPAQESPSSSKKQRELSPGSSDEELAELVGGNSAFALDLYHQLTDGGDNLFYSPYSISLALAMTYAGARGDTEQEMAESLHFLLPQERLHPAFNGLDLELARRGEGAVGKDGEGFRLNIVNAIWGQKGYALLPDFLDVLAANYGAGLRVVDFMTAAEEARVTINEWVSDETEGRIEDLIPQGVLDALTRLVLTNAIYFNAAWSEPFEPSLTEDGPFYLLDDSEVMAPMMRQTTSLGYTRESGYTAVELPYSGGEISMVLVVPDAGEFEAFESGLNADQLSSIMEGLERREVALSMPRFEMESEFSLNQALAAMGMGGAFTTAADFSGMTDPSELFISDVIHKAFVSVDEAGTEAAAATAVVMRLSAMPAEPVEVTVDRPFVFLIRDIQTGAILFVGRILNPVS
jgi:serpin B